MENVSIGSFHQSDIRVLDRVHWDVSTGQFWVVAGHHASGKSDLLMTTSGLAAPAEGTYRLFGETMPIFDDSKMENRLKVGLVFSGGQLLNQLTLGENVALPLRYHLDLGESAAREQASSMIEAMELSNWLDRTPGTVGRHWQQRVGLARALVLQPDLLLLDDPLSGLDVRHTDWWLGFLGDLNLGKHAFLTHPVTVVVTTDTLLPWWNVATHCAVLENGEFSALGCLSEREVREHARVREFLAHSRWAFDPREHA